MRKSLMRLLRSPKDKGVLTLHTFESEITKSGEEEITQGVLVAEHPAEAYPIIDGVPIMLDMGFTEEFLQRYGASLSKINVAGKLKLRNQHRPKWSFSSEWESHFKNNLFKTWGWTLKGRVEQFCLETGLSPEDLPGKVILDAGCGNGQLSEQLSLLGATVVALDFSTSVFFAEKKRESTSVHFIQGDLQNAPFGPDTFDLIYSSGVLHHTSNTYTTFREVARLARPGGRFFIWLYRRPEQFFRRYVKLPFVDLLRLFVSRIPSKPQEWIVKAYAFGMMTWHRIIGRRQDLQWEERVVIAYDVLTPLWRHYHTPWEVSQWFFENGYSSSTLTHWDNPYGFGMVASRDPQNNTPGSNYEPRAVRLNRTEDRVGCPN